MKTRNCKQCGIDISGHHHNAQFCGIVCRDEYNSVYNNPNEVKRLKSIERFKDAPLSSYVVCKECGFCGKDLGNHVIKIHKMQPNEYLIKHNLLTIKCEDECNRVKGSNNPAYQHGGKFSIFSEKFIHNDGSDEFKERQTKTKKLAYNNSMGKGVSRSNTTEYWENKGYTKEDAKKLVSKRQSTFSLEKCIERYGEDIGVQKWKERQEKWLNTLSLKSDEEKAEINRKKSSLSIPSLWSMKYVDQNGTFYILILNDNMVKIGITTRSLEKRYNKDYFLIKSILINDSMSIQVAFMIEQVMKKKLSSYKIKKEDCILKDGYTETFNTTQEKVLEMYKELQDGNNLRKQFIECYPKAIRYDYTKVC